jgi:hypothetical protein
VTVQLPLPANDEPHVFEEIAKSPLGMIDEIETADVVILVMVTTFPALVVPNTSVANARLVGDRFSTGLMLKLTDEAVAVLPALSTL